MITITLPIKTVAGLNAREHYIVRSKRAAKERFAAKAMMMPHVASNPLPVIVIMTRVSSGKLDSDNLQGAGKHIRDGIADAYGIDDGGDAIQWRYAQQKCKRGEFGVIVTIEPQVKP